RKDGLLVPLEVGVSVFVDGGARHMAVSIVDLTDRAAREAQLTAGVAESHAALQKALDEVRQLRDRLATEKVELRREVKGLKASPRVVSESVAIRQTIAQIQQVAPTPATVLLLGETGVGKEVVAQQIHELSPRHQRTMVRVSCAAIPTALIES